MNDHISLDHEHLIEMYRIMATARVLDERLWQLNRQGLTHFAVPCRGHEAVGVGFAFALKRGHDYLSPHYRAITALLTFGMTPQDIFMHALAKAGDPSSAGRQMFAHWGQRKHHIASLSSPQPGHFLHGVGMALASKLRGENVVHLIGFGDGSSSKGDVHEGMNFAGIHKLPCVFVCENNGYAISTPQHKQMAIKDVAMRAEGYGFAGVVVDGCDPIAVYEASRRAVEKARRGDGPTLIEAKVERLLPHTSNDDDTRYRTKEELAAIQQRDPLKLFSRRLVSEGVVNDDLLKHIESEVTREVDVAREAALAAPTPIGAAVMTHVYAE
jgi:2-oxoisovalerate dehydrogenase E1 component alpha subunit